MKHLLEYINESLFFESDESKINADNLLDSLNQHAGKLSDFVEALNTALKHADEDDNAKLWMGAIKDLFDGENGDQYKAKNHVAVKVTDLYPTQSEIDIINSAKWITVPKFADCTAMFKEKSFGAKFPVPVLVYQADGKNWIIDGHHRWSQVGLINRDASLDCMVVTGPESAKDFLKITQGVIASVLASDNNNKGKNGDLQLPVGKAQDANNIFGNALKGDKLTKRIINIASGKEDNAKIHGKEAFEVCKKSLNECGVKIENEEDLAKLVTENRDKMIQAKQTPPEWKAPRPVMPQSDAAGPNDPNDAKDGNPENEGSALYKILHKGKFPKINAE